MYKGCYNSYKFDMTDTHAIAYYGIDTKDFTFIKNSYVFNRRTNLEGSADADLAERVVGAISSFGVNGVQVDSIECGPVVTRVNQSEPETEPEFAEFVPAEEPVTTGTTPHSTDNLSLEHHEKEMIIKALEAHRGKRKDAAKALGISERTLYRKINEYGINL